MGLFKKLLKLLAAIFGRKEVKSDPAVPAGERIFSGHVILAGSTYVTGWFAPMEGELLIVFVRTFPSVTTIFTDSQSSTYTRIDSRPIFDRAEGGEGGLEVFVSNKTLCGGWMTGTLDADSPFDRAYVDVFAVASLEREGPGPGRQPQVGPPGLVDETMP